MPQHKRRPQHHQHRPISPATSPDLVDPGPLPTVARTAPIYGYWVHWTYTPAEWATFAEWEQRNSRQRLHAWSQFTGVFILLVVVAVGWLLYSASAMGPSAGLNFALIGILILSVPFAVLLGLGYGAQNLARNKELEVARQSGPHEIYIGPKEIWIAGHTIWLPHYTLDGVTVPIDTIQILYLRGQYVTPSHPLTRGYYPSTIELLRLYIPIPVGREEEALALVQRFQPLVQQQWHQLLP
ncbi:MAG: hypothetical protein M3Z04_09540 [Chloroflexota bacterium]|nr:hypothetical protein [Chloroflexota bacterium]